MNSSSFPDVNVWLALLLEDHVHRRTALAWWNATADEVIAFSRLTQMSVLRLLTTAAAMNDRPLSMKSAWRAYDRLCEDDRVALLPEPAGMEVGFRTQTSTENALPKLWMDAYLLAFASAYEGALVTFDRAISKRSNNCVLLG